MNEYAISEYTWEPFNEEEDALPFCWDCKYDDGRGRETKPCRGCEAIFVREGEPRGRLYFQRKEPDQCSSG
jgi:hypothetical protein